MRPLCVLAAVLGILLVDFAGAQTGKTDKTEKIDLAKLKLPVEGHEIPLELTVWAKSLQIIKVSLDKDSNEVVILVQTKPGFSKNPVTSIAFLDEDRVNLAKDNNVKFEPALSTLVPGERSRARVSVPDDDTLKKTKKAVGR